MKKILKSLFVIIEVGAFILCLTGCWNRRELDTLAILMGIGIDKSDNADEIEMTAQIFNSNGMKSSSAEGETDGGSSAFINLTDSGTDSFSIFRGYTHETSRKLYLAHNQVIIFGKELAAEGVHDSLDVFLRDQEARTTVNILVAKDKAKDIFESDPIFTKLPAAELSRLLDAQKATSETASLNVFEFMECLASESKSAVAPIVEVKDEDGKKRTYISGGAVFKEDKVVGELDKSETRGYLWVKDKISSGVLRVKVGEQNVVLEIIKSKTKVKAEINDDGTFLYKIKVDETGNIASQTGSENLATVEKIGDLEKAAAELIKSEIQNTINKAFELDADIFGFGEMLHDSSPKEWEEISDNWGEIFKNIQIEIDVSADVLGIGRIVRPDYPEKE